MATKIIPIREIAGDAATDNRTEQERTCDPQISKPSATNKRNRARAFTQADVVRAVRGVVKAGLGPIWRVRIETTGAILIEVGTPGIDAAERDGSNPWDQALADLEKKAKL
jgi:hypothetical protein